MRILQVISSFPPAYSYGGPPKVAYEISKELVKRGHEVSVYTTDVYTSEKRFQGENPSSLDGIDIYRFKNLNNNLAHSNLSLAPEMASKLNKSINNFDLIHLREYRTFQAIFVSHYARKKDIPYILQPHGSLLPIFEKKKMKKFFDIIIGQKILNNAKMVIALNSYESYQCQKMRVNRDKVRIVPNPIDVTTHHNIEAGSFKEKYGLNADEKIILYLGRIHKIKGIDLLVKAFSYLINELDLVKLVIVGPDDGFSDVLKRLINKYGIANDVLFTGPLYGNDKYEAYFDADVYVLPSRYEIFGNTILEASICGTPVIVTDRCGLSDFVNEVGSVVPYDEYALKDAIKKVLKNDSSIKKEEILNILQNRFGLKKVVNNIEQIYDEIL